MDKLIEYIPIALAVIGGLVVAATPLVAMSKTKKDDKVLGFIGKFLKFFADFAHSSVNK